MLLCVKVATERHPASPLLRGMQDLVLQYRFNGWPVDEAGAPPLVHLVFRTWEDTRSLMLDFVYQRKQPTRFAEALWLTFQPSGEAADLDRMQLSKVDSWVSPSEVVRNQSLQQTCMQHLCWLQDYIIIRTASHCTRKQHDPAAA